MSTDSHYFVASPAFCYWISKTFGFTNRCCVFVNFHDIFRHVPSILITAQTDDVCLFVVCVCLLVCWLVFVCLFVCLFVCRLLSTCSSILEHQDFFFAEAQNLIVDMHSSKVGQCFR